MPFEASGLLFYPPSFPPSPSLFTHRIGMTNLIFSSGSTTPHYYSYVHSGVMVIALSGEQSRLVNNSTEEYIWLKKQLER